MHFLFKVSRDNESHFSLSGDEHRPRRALLLRRRGLPHGRGGHGQPRHHHLHVGELAQGVQEDRAAAQVPAQVHLDIQGQEAGANR